MLNYFTFPIIVLLPQKQFFELFWRILSSPFTVPANSKSFKIAQKPAFEAKGRQYTTDNVIQRLFNIVL